jgi:hypothetical protein
LHLDRDQAHEIAAQMQDVLADLQVCQGSSSNSTVFDLTPLGLRELEVDLFLFYAGAQRSIA